MPTTTPASGWPTGLITVLISVLFSGIVAAYFTALLARRTYYHQRWWERKADAYSAIIDRLYVLAMAYGTIRVYAKRERTTDEQDKEWEDALLDVGNGYAELRKIVSIGAYVISEKAVATLEGIANVAAPKPYDETEEQIRKGIHELRLIAKKDLGV
jgi:multidrug efflux pump subunit AcrB